MSLAPLPSYDYGMDGQQDSQIGYMQGELEESMITVICSGESRAKGTSGDIKTKWALYNQMKYGRGVYDNPNDPATIKGIHLPTMAKFIDIMVAQVLTQLIPNPSDMDFFDARPKWVGLESHIERLVALLRNKFKCMAPEDAKGFYQIVEKMLDDLFTIGNVFGYVKYNEIEGGLNERSYDTPSVEYIVPENVWPWAINVQNITQTPVSIYSPIDDYELDEIVEDPVIRQRIREQEPLGKTSRSDDEGMADTNVDPDLADELHSTVHNLYDRNLYFGWFPYRDIVRNIYGEDSTRKITMNDKQDLINDYANLFNYDPNEAMGAKWWIVERVGQTLVDVRPYPLWLPEQRSPIMHFVYKNRNGYLYGHGFYDRGAWDERLLNAYNKAIITLGLNAADPPEKVRESMVDPKWLQEKQDIWTLEPGENIPVTDQVKGGPDPIEPMHINTEAIPLLEAQKDRHEKNMRELTPVTSAVEGVDKSRTATQSANNLQQSLVLAQHVTRQLEENMMGEIVKRVYVVMRQGMIAKGGVEYVPKSFAETQVQFVPVTYQDLVGLTYVDFKMTGALTPGNRIAQAQALDRVAQIYGPPGIVNMNELLKLHLKVLDISGGEKLVVNWNPNEIMERIYNIMQIAGPQGMQMLPWMQQMLAMQMFTQGFPMMGMGAGNVGGNMANPSGPPIGVNTGGQPSTASAAGRPQVQPTGPSGLPMARAGGGMR